LATVIQWLDARAALLAIGSVGLLQTMVWLVTLPVQFTT
jgi:hypothetical protein